MFTVEMGVKGAIRIIEQSFDTLAQAEARAERWRNSSSVEGTYWTRIATHESVCGHCGDVKETPMSNQDLPRDSDGQLSAYAFPGGYPMFYLDNENNILCPDCANKEGMSTDVRHCDINWEDDSLTCDDCNKTIESAYGDKEN